MKNKKSKPKTPLCPLEEKKREIKIRLGNLEAGLTGQGLSIPDEYMLRHEIRRMREFLRELDDADEFSALQSTTKTWH